MNANGRRETAGIIVMLGTAAFSLTAISASGAEPALYVFSIPLFFLVMCCTPAVWSRVLASDYHVLFRLSITASLAVLPFYAFFLTRHPYTGSCAAAILIFLALEGIYWAFLYSAGRILYSVTLFATAFLPLLVYSFIIGSPGSVKVFAVSPFGFLYLICKNEWCIFLIPPAAAHAVPLMCACTAVLLRRRKAEGETE